jgi:hypothetical protein
MPRVGWIAVAVLMTGLTAPAAAQPLGPLGPISPLAPESSPPFGSTPINRNTPTQSNYQQLPPAILGAPVSVSDRIATPTSGNTQFDNPPQRAAALGAPRAVGSAAVSRPTATPVSSELVDDAVERTAYQPPASDPVNDFLKGRSELKEREPARDTGKSMWDTSSRKFGDWGKKVGEMVGDQPGGRWFQSDHLFDSFTSPVTNPFLFEDPRALTEVRPIFIYQGIPSSSKDFFGGNISFFGVQGRVAFTDRWSLVFNKFGGIVLNPNDSSPFGDNTGFAELWLGPKWTFLRSEEYGIAAAGLQFQLPVGSKSTFQNTGDLSLVPYVSYAKNFLRDFQFGSFNVMASTGYTFSVNNERSDYYWLSGHLDFDVANAHRFYPLMEMNWFLVTSKGQTTPIGVEGRDLINFGGQAKGTGLLTGAFGARGKLSENAQIGGAFEFPFAGRRDLFRYRFTIDFILRY